MKRRYPALVVLLASLGALAATSRSMPVADTPTFASPVGAWMPHASDTDVITGSWFCPGVPATGEGEIDGELVIANRDGAPLIGSVVLVNERAQNVVQALAVQAWSTQVIDLDAALPGQMVGAIVEFEGGGGLVEQVSRHPAGDSRSACASATSDQWYFADGYTVEGSIDQIVLMNPNDDVALVTLTFSTAQAARAPGAYSGLVVPARSVRVIDLGAPGAGAQSEPLLAVHVEASQGRIAAGRAQSFLGGGRLGHQVSLGAPALSQQWWFAGGRHEPGFAEQYVIYNPTDDDVDVDPIFLGIPTLATVDPISVPSGAVVTFDPATVTDLPATRYSAVFSTLQAASVVVERVTTQIVDSTPSTSVILGATSRYDGFLSGVWRVPIGPAEPTPAALVVYNFGNEAGRVTVSAIGPSGPVPVPGLIDLELPPPSGLLVLDLTDPAAIGHELVVESTNPVFVERALPTGRGESRTSSWAIPQG